jgi:hypothetical protein
MCSRGVMVNTLVYKPLVYKGFQWLLYNGTVVHVYGYEGGRCTRSGAFVNSIFTLLQEQQKTLRGRFGCHHLYPTH